MPRVAPILFALVAALAPAIPAGAAQKELPQDVYRIEGSTPADTAAAFALDRFQRPLGAAYIVTSASYADALSVAPEAGRNDGAVLFVTKDAVPTATRQALAALLPSSVWIIGGEGAISATVATEIARITTTTPRRIAGIDRYATAAAVARRWRSLPDSDDGLFVASGTGFADALGGASAAASEPQVPLLLTDRDVLPPDTITEILRLAPDTVSVLGGTAAVSDAVVAFIESLGPTVVRIAGTDRYQTAALVATSVFQGGATEVAVATGGSFTDALVAAPLGLPMLLVPPPDAVPAALSDAVAALGALVITIVGTPASVSDAQAGVLAAAR